MNSDRYRYSVKLLKVVDGDTVDVDIDLGFGMWYRNQRIRLLGLDTPESRTRDKIEKVFGLAAKRKLRELLESCDDLVIKTSIDGKGKFGRILGDFLIDKDVSVVQTMIEEHYGVSYHGQSKKLIEVAHLQNRYKLVNEGKVNIVL